MESTTMVLVAIGLTEIIVIPSIWTIAQRFKRSQQWQAENGHDRTERSEYEWYWSRVTGKKPREFRRARSLDK